MSDILSMPVDERVEDFGTGGQQKEKRLDSDILNTQIIKPHDLLANDGN